MPGPVLGIRNGEITKGSFPVLRKGDYLLEILTAHLQMWKRKYQDLKAGPE